MVRKCLQVTPVYAFISRFIELLLSLWIKINLFLSLVRLFGLLVAAHIQIVPCVQVLKLQVSHLIHMELHVKVC